MSSGTEEDPPCGPPNNNDEEKAIDKPICEVETLRQEVAAGDATQGKKRTRSPDSGEGSCQSPSPRRRQPELQGDQREAFEESVSVQQDSNANSGGPDSDDNEGDSNIMLDGVNHSGPDDRVVNANICGNVSYHVTGTLTINGNIAGRILLDGSRPGSLVVNGNIAGRIVLRRGLCAVINGNVTGGITLYGGCRVTIQGDLVGNVVSNNHPNRCIVNGIHVGTIYSD